jgi:hypothetical protein
MRLSRTRLEAMSTAPTHPLDPTLLPPAWYTTYWEVLEDISQHIALVYPQMLQSSLCADFIHAVCLKSCAICSQTAQIELLRIPSHYHPESRQKTLSLILDVIGLAKGLQEEDYCMLDPLLGVGDTARSAMFSHHHL